MRVPTAAAIASKWARVTPERSEDYEDGVRSPDADWATETVGAEERYEDGVKAAMGRKAFGRGVRKVGTAKQQEATIRKGVEEGRWGTGVRGAEAEMAAGMEAVVRVIEGVKPRPKYAKGDPRNYEIIKDIGTALHKMKTGE